MSVLVLMAGTLTKTSALLAQSSESVGSPESVAAAVFQAQRQHDWQRLLRLTHPDGLEKFKRQMVGMLSLTLPGRSLYAEKAQRQLLGMMFGVASVQELRATSADTLLVRQLTYVSSGPAPSWSEPTILGHVLDGDSVAYVVLRRPSVRRAEPKEPLPEPFSDLVDEEPRVDFMTLKRDAQGRWCTMLDGGVVFSLGGFGLSLHEEDEPH